MSGGHSQIGRLLASNNKRGRLQHQLCMYLPPFTGLQAIAGYQPSLDNPTPRLLN
jgi:hypothetical protein